MWQPGPLSLTPSHPPPPPPKKKQNNFCQAFFVSIVPHTSARTNTQAYISHLFAYVVWKLWSKLVESYFPQGSCFHFRYIQSHFSELKPSCKNFGNSVCQICFLREAVVQYSVVQQFPLCISICHQFKCCHTWILQICRSREDFFIWEGGLFHRHSSLLHLLLSSFFLKQHYLTFNVCFAAWVCVRVLHCFSMTSCWITCLSSPCQNWQKKKKSWVRTKKQALTSPSPDSVFPKPHFCLKILIGSMFAALGTGAKSCLTECLVWYCRCCITPRWCRMWVILRCGWKGGRLERKCVLSF